MVRGAISFGSMMFAASAVLLVGLHKSGEVDVFGVFLTPPEVDAAFQRGFRSDAMAKINRLRGPAGIDEVRGDESMQGFLAEWVSSHPDPKEMELNEVFDALQSEFPGAQYLAANLITSRNREDLLGKLTGWTAVANPDFDSINTSVFRAGSRFGALGVMSRRIPLFCLEAANAGGGRFHNRCPHCDIIHALELDRDSRTLILSCPHCDLPFDVLATGSSGEIRRATDFFDGFQLREDPAAAALMTGEERVAELWGQVADQCEYELDQDWSGSGGGEEGEPKILDVWKFSKETWDDGAGDCEDTAILLADVLISAGFEARVAIGWNGNIGQHAWVVVRIGSRQYILESTLQKTIEVSDLADVAEASAFYQPEQLLDRDGVYFTTARPDRFRHDYFSGVLWKRIPQAGFAAPELTVR